MLIREILPFIEENQRNIKIHCAIGRPNKFEPLYSFSKGAFKKWQNEQNNKNFERGFILSLIFYKKGEWLFAGIYKSLDVNKKKATGYEYKTELTNIGKDLIGRLVVFFEKDFRASYLKLENHIDNIYISEIFKRQYKLDPFPGFENVNVNYSLLKEIITETEQSWKSSLSNVKGVYLISDKKTGKLYVGSAYGENAFWTRWESYVKTGHGGNVLLKTILGNNTVEYLENFSFSILEIMKMNTDDSQIIEREVYWKNILLTRTFGYNKN
jgi:hypothetical protein